MNRKKYMAAVLSGLLLLSAAGCGGTQAQEETGGTQAERQAESAQSGTDAAQTEKTQDSGEQTEDIQGESAQGAATADGELPAEAEEAISSLSEEARSAYHSVLYDIYFNHLFPDEKSYGFLAGADISENEFAIYDVDQDGSQELLIAYTTTDEAGKTAFIYDFVSALDMVREEFIEYPMLTFYDNGYIEAGLSHNQGLGGESFWPYTLYQYDSESDTYVAASHVDAWDRSVSGTDAEGNEFPEEIDVSGAGTVYYITPDGEDTGEPVDQAEYDAWVDSWKDGAQELEIPWLKLTDGNINRVKQQPAG